MTQTVAGIDWDQWRAHYDTLTFADQQAFYERVAELHPTQRSADTKTAHAAFDVIASSRGLVVTELGGWDGTLAASMLTRPDVVDWTNYDIVGVPQRCYRPDYRLVVLGDYLWNLGDIEGDVFVSCHTIEHLKARDLGRLFRRLRTRWIYLEAPIDNVSGGDWTGYDGSHILEVGWRAISDVLGLCGYEPRGAFHWAGLWEQA